MESEPSARVQQKHQHSSSKFGWVPLDRGLGRHRASARRAGHVQPSAGKTFWKDSTIPEQPDLLIKQCCVLSTRPCFRQRGSSTLEHSQIGQRGSSTFEH
ncbi:hypothetical protein AOLI_G00195820 [Acnodon oligacanthus]